jgi:hypothetical protein
MNLDHIDKLERLKAEYVADEAEIEANLVQLEQQRDDLEHRRDDLRRLIEGLDGVLSSVSATNRHPQSAGVVPSQAEYGNGATPTQESRPTTNGLPEQPSRRQLILQMLPEFRGRTFTARDIREKFVEEHLENVPEKNFPQAIHGLLQRMVNRGEIEQVGREGPGPTDPWLYRETGQEEAFDLGP